MACDDEETTRTYKVVKNLEDLCSIWPADKEDPLGWVDVGKSGTQFECLAYIREIWTSGNGA